MPSSCIAQLLRNCSGCSRVFCYSYLVYGQLHARIGGIHAKCQHVHPQRPHTVRARHESAAERAHDANVRVAAQELAVPALAASCNSASRSIVWGGANSAMASSPLPSFVYMTPSSITASAQEESMRSAPAGMLGDFGCNAAVTYALEPASLSLHPRPKQRVRFPAS